MNFKNQDSKLHYRMYKSGKQWLIAGVITAGVSIIAGMNISKAALADNVTPSTVTNEVGSQGYVPMASVSASSNSVNNEAISNSTSEVTSSSVTNSEVTSVVNPSLANLSAVNINVSGTYTSSSNGSSSDGGYHLIESGNGESGTSGNLSSANVVGSSTATSSTSGSVSGASSGAMLINDNGSYYYFNKTGLLDASNPAMSAETGTTTITTTDSNNTINSANSQKIQNKDVFITNGKLFYYTDNNASLLKGQVININGNSYYFDSVTGEGTLINDNTNGTWSQQVSVDSSGNKINGYSYTNSNGQLLKGIQSIDGNIMYFDPTTGIQLKGGLANLGETNYYFDSQLGNLISPISQVINSGNYVNDGDKTKYVDASGNTVKGLAFINNNLQYFDLSTGEMAKSTQVVTNGITYYFNKDGNGQYLFTNSGATPSNDFTSHNVINSVNASDFTNTVDGFLTADSWYRPKYILDNGTWRASNAGEYRPIITTWWPNKNVEVNYLNFMRSNGILASDAKYSLFTDQEVLDNAAQSAQVEIERKIKQQNSTDWLNNLLFSGTTSTPSFVKQQFIWNADSEYQGQGDAIFQGGYFKFGNNKLTPETNSNYRNADNSLQFLLANDVDNSNPAVQAEDLNWLYYLLNFGSITTNGVDNDSNFDSIRIDAVDDISHSSIQRTYDYLRDAYKLTDSDKNANSHISIVEAGAYDKLTTSKNDALVASGFDGMAGSSLNNGPGENSSLSNFIRDMMNGELITDYSNYNNDVNTATYSFVHSHDKGVQFNVVSAIDDATGAGTTGFTNEQLKNGLALYYSDQRSNIKKYSSYNVPSAYALLLTNKGTVPRVFYGDMFQDDDQFMQKQSIYYNDIVSMMLARKKYVAGGQTMSVDNNGFLKSVRFGNGAMTASDNGTAETRNEGIGLVVANDPSTQLVDNATVTLDMGAAHKNQAYRALMLTTKDGIQTYDSDSNSPIAYTDDNGILTFSNQNINNQANTGITSVLNPEVSGYLSAWVPVGASDDQDARVATTDSSNYDNKVFHSNPALDSNLIFEGFSNFQPMPTSNDERANVVIAKNAQTFSNWGVTSFEMAPQYRSSNDKTFLDSTIDNGYAFSDRYDLGFNTPTKYGSDEDLRQAIKALHASGMQVMADVVYNQLYNLPGQEVVPVSRAGWYGNDVDLPFGNQLYVVNTIGDGKYQEQYGGTFLNEIRANYPDLFKASNYRYNNISAKLDALSTDEIIKQWSAKYMDGSNVLGRGMGYVLKNWNNGQYFRIDGDNSYLPNSYASNDGGQQSSNGGSINTPTTPSSPYTPGTGAGFLPGAGVVTPVASSTAASADGSATSAASSDNSSAAESEAIAQSNAAKSAASSTAASVAASTAASKAASTAASKAAFTKAVKKAKTGMQKATNLAKKAKQLLAKNKSKKNIAKYKAALKAYYKSEKNYLKTSKQYNPNFLYDFDKLGNKLKLSQKVYVYDSPTFDKENRVGKISSGSKVKIKTAKFYGNKTRVLLGKGQYITGLKSFFDK